MKRVFALTLCLIVGGGLMFYSASRTAALLQVTLPAGQKEMAYLALLAFDGGLIAWTLLFMFGAEGAHQRAISGMMILVSLVGVIFGFGADSILGAQAGGLINAENVPDGFGMIAVLLTVGIIAANIASVTFFHVFSLENRQNMRNESFKETIEEAADKKSRTRINDLAADLGEEMAESRMYQLKAYYRNAIATELKKATTATLPPPASAPGTEDDEDVNVLDSEELDAEAAAQAALPPATATAEPTPAAALDPALFALFAQAVQNMGQPAAVSPNGTGKKAKSSAKNTHES